VTADAGESGGTLGRRALNRATLARQHLLARTAMPAAAMVKHLVGMQAQVPENPYVALWSRLQGFEARELSDLLEARRAVRGGLMRGTLHLVTDTDYLALEPLLRPVLDRLFRTGSPFGRQIAGVDLCALLAVGRELLETQPRTRAQLVPLLAAHWPDHDASSLAYALTYLLPLVQVTPRGLWRRSGPSAFTTVEAWLGRSVDPEPDLDGLVGRYLAAFGPATVADMRSWSGISGLREVVDRLRPGLLVSRDERGRELFDVPDAPRPDPDMPAPIRFMPEYDNMLLGHADRSRFGDDERVAALFGDRPIGLGVILVDGRVQGTWRVERGGSKREAEATLRIRTVEPLGRTDHAATTEEGHRLLEFLAAEATSREVRIASPG
jgi:winged helix DNA-binding protein